MKSWFRLYDRIYCAFCKSPRRVFRRKHTGPFQWLGCALAAAFLSYVFVQGIEPLAFGFFVGFLVAAEAFVQFRWRASVICSECGFDPVLYLQDRPEAVIRVKEHLKARAEDPMQLIKRPPGIPVIYVESEKTNQLHT
jgi:hypothetical protein